PDSFIAIGLLLAGTNYFSITNRDVFNSEASVFFQAITDVRPVHLLTRHASGKRTTCFRSRVEKLPGVLGCFQIGVEGHTDHGGITTFPADIDINALADTEYYTQVEPGIGRFKIRIV